MSVSTSTSQAQTIADTLRIIVGAGNVCEIRILGVDGRKNRTDAGYFNDFDAASKAVLSYSQDSRTKGCYVVLNEINPALLARSANRITQFADLTTKDNDITRRRWILIDADPERPTGISATDAELDSALSRANDITDWLLQRGFCEPILSRSGNGAHLLCPVDLPNDEPTTAMVKATLHAVSAEFSDNVVKVDESVFNAARISRLYGTFARKGDSTPDRPHRISEMIHVPDYLTGSD